MSSTDCCARHVQPALAHTIDSMFDIGQLARAETVRLHFEAPAEQAMPRSGRHRLRAKKKPALGGLSN